MKDKYAELEEMLNDESKIKDVVNKMKTLEEDLELKRDEVDVYALNLEESEFNNGQLEVTIN
jgi:hypothetical protein